MVRVLGRANSINVQKVMWLAAEIGLAVDRIDLGGAFGGNDRPDYLAKNPTGRIPTLEDGDFVLWESNSIVRYLAETYGTAPWLPADTAARHHASQWMDWYLASVHAPMTVMFQQLIRTAPEDRDREAVAQAVNQAAGLWRLVDGHLASRPYLTGDDISMGDIPLGCAAYRWHTLDVERPDLANLRAWYDRLNGRPAFRQNVMLPLT